MPDDKLRLGGMALRNGLLVHGPTHWSAAIRNTLKLVNGNREQAVIDTVLSKHENELFLSGVKLPEAIVATGTDVHHCRHVVFHELFVDGIPMPGRQGR